MSATKRVRGPGRKFLAFATVIALMLVGAMAGNVSLAAADTSLPSPSPLKQRDDKLVTADELPTVQINDGYVWAQTTVGTTVYAVGQFSNVRPAGAAVNTQLTPRSNVLAYDITTGNLITSFAPQVNGVVKSVTASPDGKRIYLGGSFSKVNGQDRWNIAAVDATTGALVSGFVPSVGGSGVYALATIGDTVYAGGLFTQANGVARKNLAAFNTSNGALLAWAPTTDLQVDAMVTADANAKVIIGGRFYQVNAQVQRGLAALEPGSGAVITSWQAPSTVKNGWSSGSQAGKTGIFGLSSDANGVYGTGWSYAGWSIGNLEGAFAAEASTGAIRWVADCHGDHYGVYSTGSVVYTTNHTHACETVSMWPELNPRTYRYAEAYTAAAGGVLTRSATADSTYMDWSGTPSPTAYNWFPDFTVGTTSGLGQAGLSITGAAGFISIGGEFGSVNNKLGQGLTRFSTAPPGGAKQGPRVSAASWVPTATSAVPGAAYVTIPANWDRDDLRLTYELRRSGSFEVLDSTTAESTWWNLPTISLRDTTAPQGSSQTYTVTVKDADGNAVTSGEATVQIASGASETYANAVLSDSASLFWRLGGDTRDLAGSNAPLYGSGVRTETPGAIVGSAQDTSASTFSGNSNGRVSSTTTAAVGEYSTELWFKTTTRRGGKLIGYGNSRTGQSGSYDRHVYMLNDGRLTFGLYPPEGVKTVTSPNAYNDGQWHQMVATLGANGMNLYVDGTRVASDATVTRGESYTGYWRVGGDNLSSWPDVPSSSYFSGSIDDVSVYSSPLTLGQVQRHYALGLGQTPPEAGFRSTTSDLSVSFDAATTTTVAGQSIASYAWDFGDGTTSTEGPVTQHTYATPGTYQVTLTVADQTGVRSTVVQAATAEAPNVPPSAALTLDASGLTVTADGSGSNDPDGTITGYSWNWGDDTAPSTTVNPTHAYGAAGTYTVTLTVTDDRGKTAQQSQTVTVTHQAPVVSFTASANGLSVSTDASASAASDGATLSYRWEWGDGTTGTGVRATHTYATKGSYTVKLTATDSLGAKASQSADVEATGTVYAASDTFGRTLTSGWGDAEVGGTWSAVFGTASVASVADGTGRIVLDPGATRNMALPQLSVRDTETRVSFSLDSTPASGGSYVGVLARQSTAGDYAVRVWMRSDGTAWLVAQRGSTVLTTAPVSGLTWNAGTRLHLATEVQGSSPTTLKAKLWVDGASEPQNWQLSTTDSTAGLQAAGYSSVHFARGASATTTSTATFDDYSVRDLTQAQANEPPVAAFTTTASGLAVTVDGRGSTDPEGAIATYAWDFGDGTTGSGATASHTYRDAGTHAITLTVTDAAGATNKLTRSVTVTAPPAGVEGVLAQDAFGRTTTGGWGNADQGGGWSVAGGAAAAASTNGTEGVMTLAPGQTRNLTLPSTSVREAVMSVDASIDQAPTSGTTYFGVIARQVGSEQYLVRAWLRADGTVWLVTQRGAVTLNVAPVSGVTWRAGDRFSMKVQVDGTSSTTLRAKLWKSGTTQPDAWQVTSTDATAALQKAGSVGLHAARGSTAQADAVIAFDDLKVTAVE